MNLLKLMMPNDNDYLISSGTWLITFILVCGFSMLAAFLYQRFVKKKEDNFFHAWTQFLIDVIKIPFLFLLGVFILYALAHIGLFYYPNTYQVYNKNTITLISNLLETVCFFWMIFNVFQVGKSRLNEWFQKTNSKFSILIPALSSSVYVMMFLVMIHILLPELHLAPGPQVVLHKLTSAFIIMMFGWVFIQLIQMSEKLITNQYITHNANLFTARKIKTQLLILKRIVISIVLIIVFASILRLFDSVKNLGTGLLTTAGLISAVGAFASQQSLSRLFSGLLIAFTQPIRIGDTIIIDKELGQVEEITLSYIVVKLWDLRRLILPTDYFTNRGLQNLTRESSELLGTIYFYTDYTLPVEAVRRKFFDLLKSSALWNKQVAAFHVTDIKDNCMEMRGLMSADNSGKLWELRCEIREKLIQFIVENFPECLSKSRSITTTLTKAANHF